MENEKYELDDVLEAYIKEHFPQERGEKIIEIIETIDELNDLGTLDIAFDLQELESQCVEIINTNTDKDYDVVVDLLTEKFRDTFRYYLSTIGFTIVDDVTFKQLNYIFEVIQTIITLDPDATEEAYNIINNQEQATVETVCGLLDAYSPLSYLDLYSIIEDVDDDFLDALKERYEYVIFRANPDVDDKLKQIIEDITKVDHNFLATRIVNKIIQEGLPYTTFNNNVKLLYNNLEELKDNMNMVPYEIVATFALSSDTKEGILEHFKEDLNLESVSWIGEEQAKHTLITNLVQEICVKLSSGARL